MTKKILLLVLVVFIVFSIAMSSAAEFTVCSSECNYTKIQNAIDSANPGDLLIVKGGTYIKM